MAPRYGSSLSAMLSYPNVILSERTVRRFMLSYSDAILSYGRVRQIGTRSEVFHDPWFLSYAHGEERMVKSHAVVLDSRSLLHNNDGEECTPQ